jgi:hypothetical protein
MKERGKRIDGEENLASCCWNWKKKKNNGSRKWNQGKGREPYLTVGLPLGAVAAMVDRNGVGREEDRPAGGGGRDEQARESPLRIDGEEEEGSRAGGRGRCDAFGEYAGVRVRGSRGASFITSHSPPPGNFGSRLVSLPCVCVFFVVWAGRFASLRLSVASPWSNGLPPFGPHHTVTLVHCQTIS